LQEFKEELSDAILSAVILKVDEKFAELEDQMSKLFDSQVREPVDSPEQKHAPPSPLAKAGKYLGSCLGGKAGRN
jgi:hypothetical protein